LAELGLAQYNQAHGSTFDSKVMQEMGRKGGKKGAKMRAQSLTAEQRSEIARKTAKTRWAKAKKKHETIVRQAI
jgi:hypothetical protein